MDILLVTTVRRGITPVLLRISPCISLPLIVETEPHLTQHIICITTYLCNGLACRIGSRLIKARSTLSSRVLILRTTASLKNNMQICQFFNSYSSKDQKTIHAIPSKSNSWLVYWFWTWTDLLNLLQFDFRVDDLHITKKDISNKDWANTPWLQSVHNLLARHQRSFLFTM